MPKISAMLLILSCFLCVSIAASAEEGGGMTSRLMQFAGQQHFRPKAGKNPYATFCRKMLSDLVTGKNFEDPRPVAVGEDALHLLKCKPVHPLDEGTGTFTGYEYEMNEDVDDGPEYVFVSEEKPGAPAWIKTVNEDTCVYYYPEVSGGRFDEDDDENDDDGNGKDAGKDEPLFSFSGLINYKSAPYIVHGEDHFLRIARFHADTKERLTKNPAALRRGANCVFIGMENPKKPK